MGLRWMMLAASLTLALALPGCSKNEPVLEDDEVPTEPGPGRAERQPTSNERLSRLFDDDLDDFRRQARDELNVVVRDIEAFESRVDESGQRVRADLRDFTDDLNARAEELRLRLQTFEAESEDEFRDEKSRIEAELRRLEDDVDRLGDDIDGDLDDLEDDLDDLEDDIDDT